MSRLSRLFYTVTFLVVTFVVTATISGIYNPSAANAQKGVRYDDLPNTAEFVIDGRKWNHRNLTYFFLNGTSDIGGDGGRQAVRDAFALWAGATSLSFTEVSSAVSADIVILWGVGDHGDGSPFDGVNGVLAHAYYPPSNGLFAGDAHFDDSETWTLGLRPDSTQPMDLVTVAAHEIGHSLGLGHSPVPGALMDAFYNGSHRFLHQDDIDGIRFLYPPNKADAIVINEEGVYVRRSNGFSFLPNELWTERGYFGTRGTFFADATGDGRADAIVVNEEGVWVRRSNGASFLPNELWTEIGYFGTIGTFFADATGDGKADAIVVNEGGVVVRRSNGASFLPNEFWTEGGYFGARGTFFADVTGDGRADAIAVNEEGVVVRRSNGASFLPSELWTEGGYYGTRGTFFADATGDGRADAIVVNEDNVVVRRSNGASFFPNEFWTGGPYFGTRGSSFADATGN
jgi:hypothetical protein